VPYEMIRPFEHSLKEDFNILVFGRESVRQPTRPDAQVVWYPGPGYQTNGQDNHDDHKHHEHEADTKVQGGAARFGWLDPFKPGMPGVSLH
jgi:hypothetical protein